MIKNLVFVFLTLLTVQKAHATISHTVEIGTEKHTFYPKRSALMKEGLSIEESEEVFKALDQATTELKRTPEFMMLRDKKSRIIAPGMTETFEDESTYRMIPTPRNGLCAWAALGVAPTQETILGLIHYYESFSKIPNLTADAKNLLNSSVSELLFDMLITGTQRETLEKYDAEDQLKYLCVHKTALAKSWFEHFQKEGGKKSSTDMQEARGRAPSSLLALQYFAQFFGIRIVTLQETPCDIKETGKNTGIFKELVYTGPNSKKDTQILRKFSTISDVAPQNPGEHILPTLYRVGRITGTQGENHCGHCELGIPVVGDKLTPKEDVPIPVLLTGIDVLLAEGQKSLKKETLEKLEYYQKYLKRFLQIVEAAEQKNSPPAKP